MASIRLVVAYIKVMERAGDLTREEIFDFMRELTNGEAAIALREEAVLEKEADIREEAEQVRDQVLAPLRDTEEKNKDLENKVTELREALEKEIAQQQNAGVSRAGNAHDVIEQCEIVKQPLTPAKRPAGRMLLNEFNSRETRDTGNSTGTLPIISDRAGISECDRGDISKQIN